MSWGSGAGLKAFILISKNGHFSSMIPNGTVAGRCIVYLTCGLDSLEFCLAGGWITSPTFGYYVLDRSQGVNLLHPRASSV